MSKTIPTDPDPPRLENEDTGGIWGWIAGLAVVAMIAFVVLAGWNQSATSPAKMPPAATVK